MKYAFANTEPAGLLLINGQNVNEDKYAVEWNANICFTKTEEKRDEKPEFLYESDLHIAGAHGCAFLQQQHESPGKRKRDHSSD